MDRKTMSVRKLMAFISVSLVGIALVAGGCSDADDNASKDSHHQNGTAKADAGETCAVVNTICPIMGNKVDPAKVPVSLTRQWKGQAVGFCCASCLDSWDNLSDTDKDKKLKEMVGSPEAPKIEKE